MTEKLPVLISIAHGGSQTPEEFRRETLLSAEDIFYDSDPLTPLIYDLKDEVDTVITATVARVFVDLNRSPKDRPPENPDGVVKTRTINGKKIYKEDNWLSARNVAAILSKYYFPHHKTLKRASQKKGLKLALDCHSMLSHAPKLSQNPGMKRPLFCLSNRGDSNGHPVNSTSKVTCPPDKIRAFARCIQKTFKLDAKQVLINDPFQGGFITAHHGLRELAWIQVEINREFYLAPPWFDSAKLDVDSDRIEWIRDRFYTALKLFFKTTLNGV